MEEFRSPGAKLAQRMGSEWNDSTRTALVHQWLTLSSVQRHQAESKIPEGLREEVLEAVRAEKRKRKREERRQKAAARAQRAEALRKSLGPASRAGAPRCVLPPLASRHASCRTEQDRMRRGHDHAEGRDGAHGRRTLRRRPKGATRPLGALGTRAMFVHPEDFNGEDGYRAVLDEGGRRTDQGSGPDARGP